MSAKVAAAVSCGQMMLSTAAWLHHEHRRFSDQSTHHPCVTLVTGITTITALAEDARSHLGLSS